MPQFKTSKEVFAECQRNGLVVGLEEVDPAKIVESAQTDQARRWKDDTTTIKDETTASAFGCSAVKEKK